MANVSKIQTPDGTVYDIVASGSGDQNLKNSYIKYLDLLGPKNLATINSGTINDETIIPLETTIPAGDYMGYITVYSSGTTSECAYLTLAKDGISVGTTVCVHGHTSGGGNFIVPSSGANQIIVSPDLGETLNFARLMVIPTSTFELDETYTDYVPSNKTLYDSLSTKADASTIYTKTEVDAALSDKVDKESGKGLSTYDFTYAMYNKLTNISAGAEVNVQSDWNVTNSSSDAYIKNKPSLGTVASRNYTTSDSSSTSTIPTSSVVYNVNADRKTTEASLLNRGSKNILKITATSTGIFTVNSDGTITINGTTGSSNSVLKLGKVTGSANTLVLSESNGPGTSKCYVDVLDYGTHQTMVSGTSATINWTCSNNDVRLVALANKTFDNVVMKPMICSTDDWALTTTFVPYAPTNRELYEMIVALGGAKSAKSGDNSYEELTDEELTKQSGKNISDESVLEK